MWTTPFRAGVAGTGWWVELEHLPGLRARADVEVAAICGRNPERLAAAAQVKRLVQRAVERVGLRRREHPPQHQVPPEELGDPDLLVVRGSDVQRGDEPYHPLGPFRRCYCCQRGVCSR